MEVALPIISKINQIIINPIIALFFAIALVFFIYGMVEYLIKSKSDPAAMQAGSKHIAAGLFGMFIMISVFALLQTIINSLPVDQETKTNIQKVLPLN